MSFFMNVGNRVLKLYWAILSSTAYASTCVRVLFLLLGYFFLFFVSIESEARTYAKVSYGKFSIVYSYHGRHLVQPMAEE